MTSTVVYPDLCAQAELSHRIFEWGSSLASMLYKSKSSAGRTLQLGEGWQSSENAVHFWNP